MVMEEKRVYCDYCKTHVKRETGKVDCYFKDSPKEEECPYKKLSESVSMPPDSVSNRPTIPYSRPEERKPSKEMAFYKDATVPPLIVPEPPLPPNPFQPPQTPQPSPPSAVKPPKRRGLRLFLSVVILLLLAGSGALAYYTFQLHSQILSLNSKISTQAATIQNQRTVIQQGQAALMATIQAQGAVIKKGQTAQKTLAQQLSNLQATSTAVAANTPLGAITAGQSPYATVSVGQTVFITFTLENTGATPWSNQSGFSFSCTSKSSYHSDAISHGWTPVCPNPDKITFIDDTTVSNGQSYTFSFYFPTSSLSAGTTYAIYWRLAYNNLLFGTEVYELVTVK